MGNGAGTNEDSAQITKVMLIEKDSRSHSTEALAVPWDRESRKETEVMVIQETR